MASSPPDLLTSSNEEGVGQGGEKEELIGRILELQNTLHDLTQRVNTVKEENCKLKSENEASRLPPSLQAQDVFGIPPCLMPIPHVSFPYPMSHSTCPGTEPVHREPDGHLGHVQIHRWKKVALDLTQLPGQLSLPHFSISCQSQVFFNYYL